MKTFSLPQNRKALLLGACASLLFAVAAQAAPAANKPVALRVGGNDTLYVYDAQGNVVASLPTGTIAKQIDTGSTSFQVSYGRDASGNLSVIVTPADGSATPVDFTLNGHDVAVSPTGVATMTVDPSGAVRVDGGSLGGVTVDGQASNAQVSASPAPLPPGALGSTPSSPTPDAIVSQFAPAPALLPGPTNQQPDVLPSVNPSYDSEGSLDPSQPPQATPIQPNLPTSPQAIINGSTGQPVQVGTNPPATTPI